MYPWSNLLALMVDSNNGKAMCRTGKYWQSAIQWAGLTALIGCCVSAECCGLEPFGLIGQ